MNLLNERKIYSQTIYDYDYEIVEALHLLMLFSIYFTYLTIQETVEQCHHKALESREIVFKSITCAFMTHIYSFLPLYVDVYFQFYLEGTHTELYEDACLCPCVFWQEGKHHVMHPEQWDEQQRGLRQPPAHTHAKHRHILHMQIRNPL